MTATVSANAAPIDIVLARLQKVKKNGPSSWRALCPAHEDRNPSLSVSEARDHRVLLNCHAGCKTADVCAAMGLDMTGLFPPRAPGAPSSSPAHEGGKNGAPTTRSIAMVQSYDYTDEHGELLYQVCRFLDHDTGKKDFRQRRPVENGAWDWKLGDVRQVPYLLPALLEAIACDRPVFIVEGEKDADTLAEHGLTATTNSGGAGKWREEFAALFTDANVFIVPDNDDPGRAHAEQVAASLNAAGAMVRIAALPGSKIKGDVTDWLHDHTRAELEAVIARAPRWTGPTLAPSGLPYAVRAIDAPEPEPITWVVEELLVAGEIGLFAGDGGSFKSTCAFHIAAAIAGGYSAFNRFPTTQRPTLILSAEDGAGVVLNRLDAMVTGHGWDRDQVLSNVHVIATHDAKLSDVKWQQHLLEEARRLNVGFIVCDPLFDLVDGDENSNSDLRPVIKFSRQLAAATGASVVIVHHATKVKEGQRAIDRVRGASSLRDASRCVLFFDSKPEGIAIEHLKMSRSEKLPPFMLTREIESSTASRAIWESARFSFQTQAAAILSRIETVLLDLITAQPGELNSSRLKQRAGADAGLRGEDVSTGLTHLQARGLIDFVAGPRGSRLWCPIKHEPAECPQTDTTQEFWASMGKHGS